MAKVSIKQLLLPVMVVTIITGDLILKGRTVVVYIERIYDERKLAGIGLLNHDTVIILFILSPHSRSQCQVEQIGHRPTSEWMACVDQVGVERGLYPLVE